MARGLKFTALATWALLLGVALTWPLGGAVHSASDQEAHDSIAMFDPERGKWYLLYYDGSVEEFYYGAPGDVPLMGDWDCDGVDTVGMYRPSNGFAYLRNSNHFGIADEEFFYGIAGDIPLAGDWDGDGCDTLAIYRASRVYVRNRLGTGPADFTYYFGIPGDRPFAGDFDGSKVTTVGLHRESTGFVYFRNSLTTGVADDEFFYGIPSDRILAGDWDKDGDQTVGIFRPAESRFYLQDENRTAFADHVFTFGESSWVPVPGSFSPAGLPMSAITTSTSTSMPPTTTTTTTPATTTTMPPITTTTTPTTTITSTTTTTTSPVETGLEFFVATSGSDGNDGSASRPWASIGYALEQVPAGGDATIWVGAGSYVGAVETTTDFADPVRVVAVDPYRTRLTYSQNPVLIIKSENVSFEGFEIVGQSTASNSSGLVYMYKAHGSSLRNNVIHDSYDNDGIRVLQSDDVVIAGNVLYNSADHMIDVNVGSQRTIIEDNVFFADYAGSGRVLPGGLSAFIVVKNSGGEQVTGNMVIRRNVFAHYEGDKSFLKIGADGEPVPEAVNITIENNLFHLAGSPVDGAFEVVDARGILFRANTFVGADAADPFAGWVGTRDGSPPSEDINFVGNIFSNPGGGMEGLIESPADLVVSGGLSHNLYWNGGNPLPTRAGDRFNFTSDPSRIEANPLIAQQSITLPRWTGTQFAGGYATIRQAFVAYITRHGTPESGSPAANVGYGGAPAEDILGNPRSATADLGAVEFTP